MMRTGCYSWEGVYIIRTVTYWVSCMPGASQASTSSHQQDFWYCHLLLMLTAKHCYLMSGGKRASQSSRHCIAAKVVFPSAKLNLALSTLSWLPFYPMSWFPFIPPPICLCSSHKHTRENLITSWALSLFFSYVWNLPSISRYLHSLSWPPLSFCLKIFIFMSSYLITKLKIIPLCIHLFFVSFMPTAF